MFTDSEIREMWKLLGEWHDREDQLSTKFLLHRYHHQRAREIATHGVIRRLHTLKLCTTRIFDFIPPNETDPTDEALYDATVYLQAFIFNVFGTLDNLARILVLERDLRTSKGKTFPDSYIGLGPDNEELRCNLSTEFRSFLTEHDGWFRYLQNYRHALAHRIPLYIPPKVLPGCDAERYRDLEVEIVKAKRNRDNDRIRELTLLQVELGEFQPMMMHSYGSEKGDGIPIWFHSQLICDFSGTIEIGKHALSELTAQAEGSVPRET